MKQQRSSSSISSLKAAVSSSDQKGVPSNLKRVLLLAILLLIGVLISQQQQQQERQHIQQQPHDDNVAVISTPSYKSNAITTTLPPTTTTITTTQSKPRWFTCGFDLWQLGPELFGDLEHVGRFGETQEEATRHDVLLQGGLNGPCQQSPESFPGQVLFVNSESRTDADQYYKQERFFQLGPMDYNHTTDDDAHNDNKSRALPKVTFGAIFFVAATTREQRQWMLDPNQRPQGLDDKRNAVVFVVNRCGGSRKEVAYKIAHAIPELEIHQNPKCQKKQSTTAINNFKAIPKQDWTPRHQYRDNHKLYGKYKYCLVLENTNSVPDYLTEKLFLAFLGGCLPIYSGNPIALRIFDPQAFVFLDPQNPHAAIQELQYLQQNQTAYEEKMAHPILMNGQESANDYLSLAQDVGNGQLRSKIRNMLGIE